MVSTPLDHKIYLLHRNLHLSAKRGLHEKKNRVYMKRKIDYNKAVR